MKIWIAFIYIVCAFTHCLYAQNEVVYIEGSSQKIEQLIGDWDKERNKPTKNLTNSRFGLHATDLGVPFEHKGMIFIPFGDIPGTGNDRDPLGYTTDSDPEDGLLLDFITNPDGNYRPVDIPGISMSAFEVPMEGVSWNDKMYLYVTTDVMTKSVVARSSDDGYTFTKLYELSGSRFINVSLSKTKTDSNYPELENTDIQVMFGSGLYRESDVFLAYQRADEIEEKIITYFRGVDEYGEPEWTVLEEEAIPIFTQPCVGELSVSFNHYIEKWVLLYNCDNPRGINCRVADHPWGPWSLPIVIFDPDKDQGYCNFIHASWNLQNCDSVHDPGREYEWGGEYGAYQFEQLATGTEGETTIYYTLSTWNPYTVVLMKSTLKKHTVNVSQIPWDNDDLILDTYPNPASESLTVRFSHSTTGTATILIRNTLGQKVASKQMLVIAGVNQHQFDTERLSSGIYYVELSRPHSTRSVFQKFMIVH